MKKAMFIIVAIIFILLSKDMNAQLIHGAGEVNAGIGTGIFTKGYNLEIGYTYLMTNRLMFSGNLVKEVKNYDYSKMNFENLELEINYNYSRLADMFFFNIGVGLLAGLERSKSPIFGEYLQFVTGELIIVSVDYYVMNWLIIRPYFKQRFIQYSRNGKLSNYFGLSINYNFSIKGRGKRNGKI